MHIFIINREMKNVDRQKNERARFEKIHRRPRGRRVRRLEHIAHSPSYINQFKYFITFKQMQRCKLN